MKREPDFDELVGEDLPAAEAARLRRAHELLLATGPLPELPPSLEEPSIERRASTEHEGVFQLLPRRRIGAGLALAAAIALVAFFGGYLAGYRQHGFTAEYTVPMHGVNGLAASAEIKVGKRDPRGNLPLEVGVSGLAKLAGGRYYEMYLTRGKTLYTCGTFAAGGRKSFNVRLSVPYALRPGEGWIVTVERPGQLGPGRTVLTT
ncbi:MAG TPA: hypothetical protein VF002_07980 [Gaiellaceae bacterium]